ALADLLTDHGADSVDAVCNGHGEAQPVTATAVLVARVRAPAHVRMTARRADGPSGDEEARPRQMAFLHRLSDSPIRATRIPYRGEPSVEHPQHQRCCTRREERDRNVLEQCEVDFAEIDVNVAIDQARHERTPAAVDDSS